eukprot:scpid44217/ scgid29409/ Spindle assembly abnormal protein 6 homolog
MSEDYFNKVVPLRLQTAERDERRCLVRVKVSLGGSSSTTHRKDLTVLLTDDEEPYFFYYVSISEDDFHGLKTQQGLRVDFSSFPHNVVNLLENCLRESSSDDPKFLLHLVCGSGSAAQLEMIETNPFKHLTHLSLKLVAGSDAALKKHLAQCVKTLKEEKALVQDRFTATQTDLSRAQQLLDERTRQLASVRAESSAEVTQLVNAHAAEVNRLKEESRKALSAAEEKLEQAQMSSQETHSDTVRRLEKQAELLSESLQRITSEKTDALDRLRQARQELAVSQEQRQSASSSLDGIKSSKEHLESDIREKSVKIGTLEERVATLEQQLRENETVVRKTSELLEKTADQKDSAIGALTGQQGLCAHLEEKVESLTAEVAKGNEIIKRMHQELRECKTKIKNRNLLAVEQEKLLAGKESDLQHRHRESETLSTALRETETELGSVRAAKESLEGEVACIQEELKKSQNVINYLNRQVTEHRLGQQPALAATAAGHGGSFECSAVTGTDGSALSAINRPFTATGAWTAGCASVSAAAPVSASAHSPDAIASAAARVEQQQRQDMPKPPPAGYAARQPLSAIQANVLGRASSVGVQQNPVQANHNAAVKRSGIPVPAAKVQHGPASSDPTKVSSTSRDANTRAPRTLSTAKPAADATIPPKSRPPLLPPQSASTVVAGALHGGLDPCYLQSAEPALPSAPAYGQERPIAARKSSAANVPSSFNSAYFPR